MRLRRLGFLCAIGAVLLSGCNSNPNALSTSTNVSDIRVLNGSPDLGPVDIYFASTTSAALATSLAYGSLSAYAEEPYKGAARPLVATAPGSPSSTKLSCSIPALDINTRYTIVIAGKVAAGATATGLQCQLFTETVYSLPANQFQLGFHYASPGLAANSEPTISFGLFSAGLNNYQLPSGNATFTTTTASGTADVLAVNVLLPAVQTAPGLGVYISPQTGSPPTTVFATVTPSQCVTGLVGAAGSSNTNNFMPYTTTSGTTTTTVSSNLSVYAVDSTAASGVALVCAMD